MKKENLAPKQQTLMFKTASQTQLAARFSEHLASIRNHKEIIIINVFRFFENKIILHTTTHSLQ